MSLDELATRLAAIPGASVGQGVAHPQQPHPELAPDLETVLREYPQLAVDAGYVEFLRSYGGASIQAPRHQFDLWVYGYAGNAPNFSELDFGVLTDDGFIQFAEWSSTRYDPTGIAAALEYHYAFDVTGGRLPGVYEEHMAFREEPTRFTLLYPSFTEWLRRVVQVDGLVHAVP